jgi:hypothetical protein
LFLRDSELAHDGYLQQAAIDRLLGEHETGRVDHGNRLWLLLNSETWYRMLIKKNTRDDLYAQINAHPAISSTKRNAASM